MKKKKTLFQKKFNLLVPCKVMESNIFEGIWTFCSMLSKAELFSRTRSSKQVYETAITHNSAKNSDHVMQEWACVQRSDGVVHTSGREAYAQLTAKTLTQRTNLIFGPIETHAFLQASRWWDVAKYLYHWRYGAEYSGADQGLWMQSVKKDALDEYGLHTWEFQHTSYYCLAEHKRAIAVDQKLSCFLLTPTFLKNNCNQVKEEFLERYRSQVKGVEKGPLPCWAFEAGCHLHAQFSHQPAEMRAYACFSTSCLPPHADQTTSQALSSRASSPRRRRVLSHPSRAHSGESAS